MSQLIYKGSGNRSSAIMVFFMPLFSVFALFGCAGSSGKSSTDEALAPTRSEVALIRYSVRESGREEYISEVIVDKKRLIMYEPNNNKDFLLFNRENQTIYSVSSDEKSIFVVKPKPVEIESPLPLKYVEISQPSSAIPKIQNMPAVHVRYDVNGEHCYDVVTLPEEFLPEVRQAMMEYRTVLAGEHAASLNKTPVDLLDACDLSVNIFHATQHLNHGVPIREWDRKGSQKFMMDYKNKWTVNVEQFQLPADYQQFSVQ